MNDTEKAGLDVEGLNLTAEEKEFVTEGEYDGDSQKEAKKALRSVIAKVAAKAMTPKLKSLENELAQVTEPSRVWARKKEQERKAEFISDVSAETGLSPQAVEALRKSPAFKTYLEKYNPALGTSRREVIAESGSDNPDPLIVAIRNFQGTKTQPPSAPKPTYSAAEYTIQMNELAKQDVYSPDVAAKIEALRTAQREGRVR